MSSYREEHYLTDRELATQLNVSINTIKSWRRRETGPRYVKMNRLVRYPISAVEEFLAGRSGSEAAER